MTAWSSFGPPRLYVGPDVEESANKISEVHMGFKTGDRYIKDVMGYNGPSGTNRFSLVRVTGIEKDSDAFVLGYAGMLDEPSPLLAYSQDTIQRWGKANDYGYDDAAFSIIEMLSARLPQATLQDGVVFSMCREGMFLGDWIEDSSGNGYVYYMTFIPSDKMDALSLSDEETERYADDLPGMIDLMNERIDAG